jgi:MYXO-CTERM domain-containing protein
MSPLHDPAPPALIALGVLLGVVRAAHARRRRPLNTR